MAPCSPWPPASCLEPLHRRRQACRLHRLEHVVDRGALERLQRVLVVGGDEDEQWKRGAFRPVLGHRLRRLEPAHARHADIEEDDVGTLRQRFVDRRFAIAGDGDDLELGPQRAQLHAQALGKQRLVFGDDGARFHARAGGAAGSTRCRGMRIVASVPPSPASALASSNDARSP